MKSTVAHLVLCLVGVALAQNFTDKNPGFRAILTSKGLNYAHDVGFSLLKEWLCNYTIPTQNVTGQTGLANVTYNFSNIQIHSLGFGQSSLTSDRRGFVLNIKDFSMSFSSNFLINETDWPYYIDRGSGDVSFSGVSLTLSMDLLVNRTGSQNGHFAARVTSCSFFVDTIKLFFKGGASFMYNLFGPALSDYLKYVLNTGTCQQLGNWTNNYTNTYLSSLPITINVADGVDIDYGLVSDANFSTKGRVVTDHKGEFLLKSTAPPFPPPPLPDPSEDEFPDSRMIYLVISKFVAESASYAFWKAGQMAYNMTSDQLKRLSWDKTTFWCKLLAAPKLCEKYPNKDVMLGIAVAEYPKLNVTPEYASLSAKTNITMYVANDGEEDIAFILQFDAEGDVDPYFNEKTNHICGNVSNAKVLDMHIINSTIGEVHVKGLMTIINALLIPGTAYINTRYTHTGVPIPSNDGITLTNTTLKLGQGYVVVGSDLSYVPDFLPSNMTCVYH